MTEAYIDCVVVREEATAGYNDGRRGVASTVVLVAFRTGGQLVGARFFPRSASEANRARWRDLCASLGVVPADPERLPGLRAEIVVSGRCDGGPRVRVISRLPGREPAAAYAGPDDPAPESLRRAWLPVGLCLFGKERAA